MLRKVTHQIKGQKDVGASGIHFVRALDEETTKMFDPFLRLDVFDSSNPDEYLSGFPTHPHRGLETITFVSKGQMRHGDHLDTDATIYDGEAQWLTAGSGAKHEEYPGGKSLLATQLWLNMPANDKMTAPPAYHSITNDEIREFPFDGGVLRLVTGEYNGVEAWQGKYCPVDFYDLRMEANSTVTVPVKNGWSAFAFPLAGDAIISGTETEEQTASKLDDEGNYITIETKNNSAEILVYSSKRLDEPIAWRGLIVMNTEEELDQAFEDLKNGTFIK